MEAQKACWRCGAAVKMREVEGAPEWLRKMAPQRILCEPCKDTLLAEEHRQNRLADLQLWTAEDVIGSSQKALAMIGVPEKLLPASFDTCPDFTPAALDRLRAWGEAPAGFLYLHGRVGSGKSWAAVAVLLAALQAGRVRLADARFTTEAAYKENIRARFGRNGADTPARLLPAGHARMVRFLVLDDLGAGYGTGWGVAEIGQLIADRDVGPSLTVVTSNLNLQEVAERMDPRIASRIGSGVVLEFPDRDLRIGKKFNAGP